MQDFTIAGIHGNVQAPALPTVEQQITWGQLMEINLITELDQIVGRARQLDARDAVSATHESRAVKDRVAITAQTIARADQRIGGRDDPIDQLGIGQAR